VITYVESSALVPLVKKEELSEQIRDYLVDLTTDGSPLVTGRVTETELRRAAERYSISQSQVTRLLDAIEVEEHTPAHFRLAGTLGAPNLRSLDALHVATALQAGCSAMVSLDVRVIAAAEAVGIPTLDVTRPAQRPGRNS
jgi:predicted nucleic acid-binding protein